MGQCVQVLVLYWVKRLKGRGVRRAAVPSPAVIEPPHSRTARRRSRIRRTNRCCRRSASAGDLEAARDRVGDVDLLQPLDVGGARTFSQLGGHFLHGILRTREDDFDGSVGTIADPTAEAETASGSLSPPAEPDALNPTMKTIRFLYHLICNHVGTTPFSDLAEASWMRRPVLLVFDTPVSICG